MKQFLIVDDDVTFARVLSRSLEKKNYKVFVANDGLTALSLLKENSSITHAVLDLKLAESTGLQLLPQLLAIRPELKVVMLTGYASVATTVEAIKQGATNYLCKPASTEEILAAFDDGRGGIDHIAAEENPLSVDRVEWEYIQRQLQSHEGNIAATARALGMHRRTLQRKLQKRPGKL
jgi:two-component system response regulator RegA